MKNFRVLLTGLVLAIMTVLLANCNGNSKLAEPPATQGATTAPASATAQPDASQTAQLKTTPTLAIAVEKSVKFFEAAPPFIGRWTLDKAKSYINRHSQGGVVLYYNAADLGDIQVSYWTVYNPARPDYNITDAIERFRLETSHLQVPTTPVSLGDRALIFPTNRGEPGRSKGEEAVVLLAILQWQNNVIDVYATSDLLKTNFDFSDAEATEFLTKMFNAIPKP